MRRTPGKAQEWATRVVPERMHCVGRILYDNLDDLFLRHEALDAVYVCTRPGMHLDTCRQVAAAAGSKAKAKAVYVEKPVGRCASETQAIMDVMMRENGGLYTAYIRWRTAHSVNASSKSTTGWSGPVALEV